MKPDNVTLLALPGVEDPKDLIDWQQRAVTVYGKTYPQPRLTRWYGPVPYTYSNLRWEADPLPGALVKLLAAVEAATGASFDCVLCNLYRSGSDCVGWHSDDEPLFGSDPVIASLSFGATRAFKMRSKTTKEVETYNLTHGSLLLMGRGVQSGWDHCLPRTSKQVGERVNLTFRKIRSTP